MSIKRFWWLLDSGGSSSGWSNGIELTANTEETIQFVRLSKDDAMKNDFSDVRFVIDPTGSGVEKLFIPYCLVSTDETYLYYKVSHPHHFSTPSATFYAIWGNSSAEYLGNERLVYSYGGWFANILDRSIQYEVNKYVAYDLPLDDDATYQHAPSPHKSPYTGQIAYTYKRSELTEHGAAEGAKIMFRKMTGYDANGYPVHSEPVVAFDKTRELFPGISATVTSVTDNGGVARFNHAGGAVYTVGAYLNNSGFSEPSYNGDFLISAAGSGYYELTTIKEEGETPISYVSTDTGDSVAVIFQVGINSNFMWTSATTGIILLDVNLIGSNTAQYTSVGLRRVKRVDVTDIDTTPQFSDPVLVGDDVYSAMSESHYIANNGWMFWMGHGISRPDLTYPVLIFYSTDNGQTINLLTIPSPSGAQLNESTCVQIANEDLTYQNKLFYVIRNEAAGQQYRFNTMQVTMDEDAGIITNSTPVPFDIWDSTSQSCPELTEVDMGHGRPKRVFFMFGDTHIMACYTENDGTLGTDQSAWKNVGYPGTSNQPVMNGSSLSCGRPQPKPIDMGNQCLQIYWCRNMRTGSPELSSNYLQFFDASLMALTTADSGTFTAARPRPPKQITNGVLEFGELFSGYRHQSDTTFTVPTSHPTALNVHIIGSDTINFQIGDPIVVNNATNRYVLGTVTNVDLGTRIISFNSTGNVGSTSASSWWVNKGTSNDTENLRSNQLLKSRWYRPGNTTKGWKMRAQAKAIGAILYQAGFKKDETLGVSTITITGTGAGRIIVKGTNLAPRIGLIADTGELDSGATVLDYVTALAESVERLGVGRLVSTTADTVVIQAPDGYGTSANGLAPAITVSGSAAATAGNFSGASTAEAASSYQNVMAETGAVPGVFHIKNSNDTFNATFTQGVDFNDIEIDINSAQAVGKVNGNTVLTKLPANGNGIPSWQAAFALGLSVTIADPKGLISFKRATVGPTDETEPTEGTPVSGSWTERTDGRGLN